MVNPGEASTSEQRQSPGAREPGKPKCAQKPKFEGPGDVTGTEMKCSSEKASAKMCRDDYFVFVKST